MKKNSEVPHDSSICGAKARTNDYRPCRRISMANGRCHLHGGKSTGAKTSEGKLIQKMASWQHGMRSKEAISEAKMVRQIIQESRTDLRSWIE
jgi:hypothetical protein